MTQAPPRYAGFHRRTAAALIDSFLLFGHTFILQLFFTGTSFAETAARVLPVSGKVMTDYLLPFALTVILWMTLLGTPGKLLMDCQVVDARTGRPVGGGQAALRYAGYFLSALPLLAGFFWVAWDKRKQGFHDRLAHTVVVMEDEADKSLAELMRELR